MFVLGFLVGVVVIFGLLWFFMHSGATAGPINPKATITDLERRTIHDLLEAELAARAASMNGAATTTEVTKR